MACRASDLRSAPPRALIIRLITGRVMFLCRVFPSAVGKKVWPITRPRVSGLSTLRVSTVAKANRGVLGELKSGVSQHFAYQR